jgi:hypothetical protein
MDANEGGRKIGRKMKITREAGADTDWPLGYIDNQPAVFQDENGVSCGYIVPNDAVIYNQHDGCCWLFDWGSGGWHEGVPGWRSKKELTDDDITAGGPDWTSEKNDERR